MAPQFGQGGLLQKQGLVLPQMAGQFGLTTRHQHHVTGLLGQAKGDGIVGGGVASVQGRDDVDLLRQTGVASCLGHRGVDEGHALKAHLRRHGLRPFNQFGPGLNAVNMPSPQSLDEEVINDEAQIRLAGPMVGQGGALRGQAWGCFRFVRQPLLQQGFNKLKQVIDLLELAAGVLVEPPLPGQDVQGLEQGNRLPRPDQLGHRRIHFSAFWFHGHGQSVAPHPAPAKRLGPWFAARPDCVRRSSRPQAGPPPRGRCCLRAAGAGPGKGRG